MSHRENHSDQVVVHNQNSTEVWEKNDAGVTTREGYSRYNPETGNTTDYWGRIIATDGEDGNTKPR